MSDAALAHGHQTQVRSHLHKRVAVLSDAIAERNGVGAYYCDLTSQLKHRLDAIELHCPHPRDRRPWHLPMPGDATQSLHLPPIRLLRRALDRQQPNVIVAPTPGAYGLFAAHEAKRRGIPLVVGFHTHFEDIADLYFSRLFGYATQAVFSSLNAHLFRRSRLVLANAEDIARAVEKQYATRVELMGTPLATTYLAEPPTATRQTLQNVLFAGRLAAEKNIGAIIDAAEQLPHIQFHIAGDGPERDKVINCACKLPNMTYHGWLDRESLRGLIDRCDLTLLPSHIESFGTIAIEVMARQRLVLVSSHCGITTWPMLRDALYVQADAEPLHNAIQRIATEAPSTRTAIALRARQRALAYNDWTVERWLELLSLDAS